MVRWGHLPLSAGNISKVRKTYHPSILRQALEPLGASLPVVDEKIEGALTGATPIDTRSGTLLLGPDGFFDGRQFDPARLSDYIEAQNSA